MEEENKNIETQTEPKSEPEAKSAPAPSFNADEVINNYLGTLGLNKDSLKGLAEQHKAKMSEADQLKSEITTYSTKIQNLEKELGKAQKLAVEHAEKYARNYKRNVLSAALNKHDAFSDDVLAMDNFRGMFGYDPKEDKVVSKNGKDIEENIKEFLKDRPHLVKATNKGGGGSQAGGSGSPIRDEEKSIGQMIAEAMFRGSGD